MSYISIIYVIGVVCFILVFSYRHFLRGNRGNMGNIYDI